MKLVFCILIAMGATAHASDLFDTISLGNDQQPPPVVAAPTPVVVQPPQPVRLAVPPRASIVSVPATVSAPSSRQAAQTPAPNFPACPNHFTADPSVINDMLKDAFNVSNLFLPGHELLEDTPFSGTRCHVSLQAQTTAQAQIACSISINAPAKFCRSSTGITAVLESSYGTYTINITRVPGDNHVRMVETSGHLNNTFTAR